MAEPLLQPDTAEELAPSAAEKFQAKVGRLKEAQEGRSPPTSVAFRWLFPDFFV